MAEITLRKATMSDEKRIQQCVSQAYASVREEIADLPDVTGGIHEDIARNDVILAEKDGQLLGVVVFGNTSDGVMIYNLAVSPDAQGQGIARRLLHAVEATADRRQSTVLRLRTHAKMRKTRAMYGHMGWVETGTTGNTVLLEKTIA